MDQQFQPCTCGEAHPHAIARRSTSDGKHVIAWSDGSLTWALGYAIKGSPNPRTPESHLRAMEAIQLVLDDVWLFDASEVSALIDAARWAAERGSGRKGMHERLHGDLSGTVAGLTPTWTVMHTDRDGRPTVRTWRLPRLAYPGLIVWHERGRYSVLREVQRNTGTYHDTGFTARTLHELGEHLRVLRAVAA